MLKLQIFVYLYIKSQKTVFYISELSMLDKERTAMQ